MFEFPHFCYCFLMPTDPLLHSSEEPLHTRELGIKTFVVYGVLLASTGLLYLLYLLRPVILQLVVALIVAVALEPSVRFFIRHRFSRIWAVTVSLGLTLLVIIGITSLIATPLISQGTTLLENAPKIVNDLTVNPQFRFLNEHYHVVDYVKKLSQTQADQLAGVSGPFLGFIGGIIGGISSFTIIMVFSFFFLLQGPDAWEQGLALLPPKRSLHLRKLAQKMARAVGGFVSGNLLISVIAGTVALITMLALHIPYAFPLAALLALFDLIPLVGAALGTVIIALVALTQGIPIALIATLILLIYQGVEGHFIQPLVYSRVISISPLLIILASVIGAELAGIIGVLLAIPVAAVLQIAVVDFLQG